MKHPLTREKKRRLRDRKKAAENDLLESILIKVGIICIKGLIYHTVI